jgi:hypothetical protein
VKSIGSGSWVDFIKLYLQNQADPKFLCNTQVHCISTSYISLGSHLAPKVR